MDKTLFIIVIMLARLSSICSSNPIGCSGTKNELPIWNGELKTVASVSNGILMEAVSETPLRVLHVFGSPYEMGVAQAQLLKGDAEKMLSSFYEYLDDMIRPYIDKLPKDIQKIILEDGPAAALQFTLDLTKKYIPDYYFEEIRGLADGLNSTKYNYDEILRLHMFPELIKAACSMFGAWDNAVQNADGSLIQLRALDWGLDNPLVNFSVLTVYHPKDLGHPFMSLTWTGFIGSVTSFGGYVGVSEKVWLKYNETSSRAGIPFHFLIRDVAQFDKTIDDALNRIYNNRRTCSVFLGIGEKRLNQFRIVEYSHEEVMSFDDYNFPSYAGHPLYDGLVFIDKHTQPSSHTCLPSLMQDAYGNITATQTIQTILGYSASGDMHAAIYDFGSNNIYVSVAGPTVYLNGTVSPDISPAHARPWYHFNTTELFEQKPPEPSAEKIAPKTF